MIFSRVIARSESDEAIWRLLPKVWIASLTLAMTRNKSGHDY
jgi:hypothetical protein